MPLQLQLYPMSKPAHKSPQDIRKRRPQNLRPRLLHLRRNPHQIQYLQAFPRIILRELKQWVRRRRQSVMRR